MKKILAVLLAVLMAFGVMGIGAAAEDAGGTVYSFSTAPRIKSNNGPVTILQAGDVIQFEKLTAATKRLEIIYYPDAASIKVKDVTNDDWKTNVIPQYNLDSSKWELDKEKGQTVDDLMAKSPNHFKSFYNYAEFVKGDVPEITITGLNAESIFSRDSAGVDRGESPIDFALDNATFVGWALYNYKWAKDKTSLSTIEVYALWDRGHAPEKPVEPENPEGSTEYTSPIQAALAKVLYYIGEAKTWIGLVPEALSTAIGNYLDGLIRNWLYGLFGIEA